MGTFRVESPGPECERMFRSLNNFFSRTQNVLFVYLGVVSSRIVCPDISTYRTVVQVSFCLLPHSSFRRREGRRGKIDIFSSSDPPNLIYTKSFVWKIIRLITLLFTKHVKGTSSIEYQVCVVCIRLCHE